MLIDGLDSALGAIQDVLSGQVFGVKLPLLGDALQNNPVVHVIDQFRSDFLRPLANTIRENNLTIDGLADLITTAIYTTVSSKLIQAVDGPLDRLPFKSGKTRKSVGSAAADKKTTRRKRSTA